VCRKIFPNLEIIQGMEQFRCHWKQSTELRISGCARLPDRYALHEQRMDKTEAGEGTVVTPSDVGRSCEWVKRMRDRIAVKRFVWFLTCI
jgi:hypothetical protein